MRECATEHFTDRQRSGDAARRRRINASADAARW